MDDHPAHKDLDPVIVQELLDRVEQGSLPSPKELALRYPGREAEVRAAIRALDRYRKRLRDARYAMQAIDGVDVFPPGTELGEFTIEGVLGRGAMGVVYRARQKSLGRREVALKVLPPALVARDPRFRERFRREAELASTVHHPHVAAVHGSGSEGETLFFAMRLVEGRTLHETLSGLALKRRLGHDRLHQKSYLLRVVSVVRDVADALAAIHARNLVHRDVKPANILLEYPENVGVAGTEDLAGRPVLVDFGLLRPVGPTDLTGTRTLLGTPAFASPESQLGREVDARADVFSLGVILHDLLTLTPPENRKTASAGLPDVRLLNPAVDARLAAVVARAIEERPAIRYADGAAFRDDLDRYLRDEPVKAFPATPVGKLRLWARRNPTRAVKAGVAGFVLLALLVAGGWFGNQVVQLYMAASRGARLVARGDIRGAALDYRKLLEYPTLARYLPGIGASRMRRARDYREAEGRLSEILGWLKTHTEDSHAAAHRQILDMLLRVEEGNEGDRDLEEPLLRFLAGEIQRGPETWKRRLAAETAAHYLLIRPRSYRKEWPPGTWERFLGQALVGVAGGATDPAAVAAVDTVPGRASGDAKHAEADTAAGHGNEALRLRLAAVSALSGLPTIRAFEVLQPVIQEDDVELCRLALEATLRIWWAVRKSKALQDITPDLVASWVEATRNRVRKQTEDVEVGTTACDFIVTAFDSLAFHAAWTQKENGYAPLPEPGLAKNRATDGAENHASDGWSRFVRELRAALDDCVKGQDPDPVRPVIPGFDVFEEHEKMLCPRPRVMFDHFNLGVNPDFVCENVWKSRIGEDETATFQGPASPDSAIAKFDFTAREPALQGAAGSVSWTGAKMEKTSDNTEVDHTLKLIHSGTSRLTLWSVVPGRAATARVAIKHCRASRKPLPYQGHARIRISILDSKIEIVNENLDAKKKPPFEFLVDERSLRSRDNKLGICIHLDSANTTYWIYEVEIEFQERKKRE